jgi:hypothetical protein
MSLIITPTVHRSYRFILATGTILVLLGFLLALCNFKSTKNRETKKITANGNECGIAATAETPLMVPIYTSKEDLWNNECLLLNEEVKIFSAPQLLMVWLYRYSYQRI